MSFEMAIKKLLDDEGGYVNDPNDPGGETKFGISKRSYPARDIPNITRQDAIDIYHDDWWVRYGYDKIIHPIIAGKLLNLSPNMGPRSAHKCTQRALMAVGEKLKVDGVLGPRTLHAINNKTTDLRLIGPLRSEAAGYYRVLIAEKPNLARYKNGWLKRAYS